MRIVGHGIDMVETARVAKMLEEHGDRFLERCFTAGERAYADDRKRSIEHLSGRFAAKEAILKVLGTGWRGGIAWTDAEVVRESSGRPSVRLHGECLRVAQELGIDQWWVSISHIGTHAIASAIGVATRCE
ncbi:MAG: holo-ACP synthase [Planctomycetes bacterium]|nr:holo-ACP synthase [Planctomycetota bacterium]